MNMQIIGCNFLTCSYMRNFIRKFKLISFITCLNLSEEHDNSYSMFKKVELYLNLTISFVLFNSTRQFQMTSFTQNIFIYIHVLQNLGHLPLLFKGLKTNTNTQTFLLYIKSLLKQIHIVPFTQYTPGNNIPFTQIV